MQRHHKLFVWLWAASLLTATVGVSVHQVYCYCLGQTSIEWPGRSEHECLAAETPVAACCAERKAEPAPKSCCKSEAKNEHKRDCKERSVKVFQLKTEFLVEKTTLKAFDFQDFVVPQPVDFTYCLTTPEVALNRLNKAPPPPPPSPGGRAICVRNSVFRC